MEPSDFAQLTPTQRARLVATTRLRKHFVGLEDAGLLTNEEAGKFIGSIKILETMLDGEFEERY